VESVLLGPVAVGPQITKILLIICYLISDTTRAKIIFMNPLQSINLFLAANPQILPFIGVWSIVWKGLALWRAARKEQKPWFVAILVLNTMGLLEIIYLFLVPKLQLSLKKRK